ncbi:MAG: phosphomannose isomerase type II C-terminal cupin domain [Syntrophales bacterium]|jgi:mannose-6-phosphate isomerase-like protein (cupin superfamily)|nr:phosphomannose isomerase type II C-terminal cupin domain [Syntrophales bacterium]MCK9527576.1 phosphomannose isomerase type II C-terminal cupin domain [Syntrophales bacterium]MDX9922193.1 phosphomannose isomerase type II C-terminal cupin domain [Syntrophales bacterium]
MEQEDRPWGFYRILAEARDHKIKRIVVHAGRRTSLQRHRLRDEHWHVIDGEGRVTLGERLISLRQGKSVDIRRNELHRIENTGPCDLVLIEIQTGAYFGEDDIERLSDDYGRA